MSLEGFSKKGMELGNNPEQINETKKDLRQQYLNAIRRLALQKMKNDLLFEGSLGAAMRSLSSLGLEVSKESMLKDIETEINRQRMSFDIEIPDVRLEVPNINVENQMGINQLKSNLGSIFESAPVQEQNPIYNSGPILREPEIQSTQSYETTMTFTGNLENLSDDVKKRIIQQMESRGEVIISSIDNIYREGDYIVVDAKDNQGRFTGTEFTLDDFTKLVDQSSTIAKTEDIPQPTENNHTTSTATYSRATTTNSQEESEKILQEQQTQMKNQIISQIMAGMNNAGEFAFGDISMGERMNIMQNVQNKLNAKSMDELQVLLSTYQKQNVQEETIRIGTRK